MSKNRYDEASVVRRLSKKASININAREKTIEIVKDNTDVGIRSWGKIDYLCNYCGYIRFFTKSVKKVKVYTDDSQDTNIKYSKRNKLNMASMIKSTMKQVRNNN